MSQNGSPAKLQGSRTRQIASRTRLDGARLRQKDSTVRPEGSRLARGALKCEDARSVPQRGKHIAAACGRSRAAARAVGKRMLCCCDAVRRGYRPLLSSRSAVRMSSRCPRRVSLSPGRVHGAAPQPPGRCINLPSTVCEGVAARSSGVTSLGLGSGIGCGSPTPCAALRSSSEAAGTPSVWRASASSD